MGGTTIPADPFNPIPASAGNRTLTLRLGSAQVMVWRGLFDASFQPSPGEDPWISAPAELLWPGTRVYIQGAPMSDDPNTIQVSVARIVAAAPALAPELLDMPELSGWQFAPGSAGRGQYQPRGRSLLRCQSAQL